MPTIYRSIVACLTLLTVCLLLPVIAWASGADEGGLSQLLERLQRAHPAVLVAALLIAPLFAVPLSALLVVLGMALPLPAALAVTVFVLWVHHLLLWSLSHTRASQWLRRKISQRITLPGDRRGQSFSGNLLFVLTATWLPGLSYIFKLAVIALAGLSVRTYFVMGILCQLAAALPYLLLGEVAKEVGFGQLALLVSAVLGTLWIAKYFISRRRRAARMSASMPEKPSP